MVRNDKLAGRGPFVASDDTQHIITTLAYS